MRFFTFLLCILLTNLLSAQALMIDTSYTPEEMIMDFFDNDAVSVSNIVYTGNLDGMAFFDSTDDTLGVHAGIVFSTGNALDLPGLASDFISSGNSADGDVDVETITGAQTFDASVIEFDFTVTEDSDLDFSYVFGSEEYPEFVGTSFNDVFAFLISGPNYDGPYSNMSENISMIPGSMDPVAINSVNEMMNQDFYINNESNTNVKLDGLTTMLPAAFTALVGETYHIKIVISDVSDSAFDSAVFLGYNSMGNGDSLVPPATASFVVDGNMLLIENESKYATSYSWDFGNGTYSSERHPETVVYETPGAYQVSLITQNYCCTDTFTAVINAGSPNALTASVEQTSDISCFGENDGAISIAIMGGQAPYLTTWTPSIVDLNMVAAGNYQFTINDANGTEVVGEITITEPTELIGEISSMDSEAGLDNGSASMVVEGGTGTYSYLWSNGDESIQITNLPAGEYTCTVTDENGCEIIETVTIQSVVNIFVDQALDLKVYPSPATEVVFVNVPAYYHIGEIAVYDITGKRVFLVSREIESVVELETQFLKKGMYYVSVITDDNKVPFYGRFVKE